MSNFLWGGGVEERKIHWVQWTELCRDLGHGGLGIKDLERCNKALMAKWLWRFLTESESLWARVVRERGGEIEWDGSGFKPERNRVVRSMWWKRVLELSRGENGRWFRENMAIRIGEGDEFLFWHQCWAGEMSLREMFPRLFRLSNNQEGLIKDMGGWVDGSWVWNLGWTRELRGREHDQLLNLDSLIQNFSFTAGIQDGWRWLADPK